MVDKIETRQVIVMVETDLSDDDLHEALCTGLYEGNEQSLRTLASRLPDIQVVGSIEKTG